MEAIELHATKCAICDTHGSATEVYPANFDFEAFNPATFSARRLPDGVHYRMVKCTSCGLVRSDPIADPQTIAGLYAQSTLTYSREIDDLKLTYGRYLAKLQQYGVHKGVLLEIGCGNGFFLEEALDSGYEDVVGVEPSTSAVAQASERLRSRIVGDIMRPGLFDADHFDVVCLFQVFDHIPDPAALLDECLRVLKAGGLLLAINHNVDSVSSRILKRRSPIVDVEHTYLFSPGTMTRILADHGFRVDRSGSVRNTYALQYLAQLLPLPIPAKRVLARTAATALGRIRLSVPLGNLYVIASKK